MNIAVIGADTRLGRRIAKDAFHRRHCVTAVVTDPSLLDSVKYTVVTGCEGFDPAGFDAVIDARSAELTITRGGVVSTLVPPAELDPDGRRLGQYTLGESTEGYIGEEDFALAAVDEAEGTEARRVTPVSGRAPALPEDGTGRRRYVALPDKGIAGKVYHLLMDDYNEYVAHFIADDRLLLAKQGEPFAAYACQCLHCDDQVWFVSFLRDKECVTLILDEAQSLVTAIYAFAAAKKPLLAQHRILFGAIKPFNGEVPFRRHGYTDEMAGTKITWHYSPYVNITHCYVNESYMRNSLAEMKPLPADAPAEAVFDAEDRVRRWGDIFFEEPAQYIRINPHLYVVVLGEANRNRMDPVQGGGDMVLAINTRRMRDYGRGFHTGFGTPYFGLISAGGNWYDMPDPMDTAQSPYLV